jgi:hypothetical protein
MGVVDAYKKRRAALIASDRTAPVPHKVAPSPPDRIAVPQFCSLYGEYSVIMAEKHGNQLKLLYSEKLPDGLELPAPETGNGFMQTTGGLLTSPAALGAFRIDGATWSGCAHCQANGSQTYGIYNVWWCSCLRCRDNLLFHCAGNRNGMFRKACGGFTTMDSLTNHDTVEVQGWPGFDAARPATLRQSPLPSFTPSSSPQIATPQIAAPRARQIPAQPSSTLRIGFKR